ncbi:MAG: DNA mismatch repair endonuclease MutL [Peptostreptococcaceae bacterium]|nr:DNA mismatch repair endonuclease MutL [Peptostreptococcaceae bacterium]
MIKLLDKSVADKIAAGEVIERPVSIIKELLENSVDAGAKMIIVDIKNGGKTYIRVSDDGIGISNDEVETAFLRHATGKITSLEDLNAINTLGFRGEALASIAAVTRLKVLTKRREDSVGTKLTIHGSKVVSKETTGCPDGTTFIIEDVFYNTPARKKFMKNDGNEAGKITEFVSKFALNYADISFKLINNNTVVFATTGDGNHQNTIMSIFPTRDYANLIEIKHEENGIFVYGFVSNPGLTKSTKQGQIFFVNGRIIDSKIIEKGIKLGYKERVFSGFPISILFISLNPETIDVNIHPNKREIRFNREKEVIDAIGNAISNSIFKTEGISEFQMPKLSEKVEIEQTYEPEYIKTLKTEQIGIKKVLQEKKPVINDEFSIEPPYNRPFVFDELRIVGYVFNTYIITEDQNDNIYYIDQHAAHERIFYEKLVNNYLSENKISQPILIPIVINTSKSFYNKNRDWMGILDKIGYNISEFGENTFLIREIPENMSLTEAELFVNDFIEAVNQDEVIDNNIVIDKLITKSCKNAIKGNNKLSESEQLVLLNTIKNCINPYNCPHGRPTFLKLSKSDIEKSFHRK